MKKISAIILAAALTLVACTTDHELTGGSTDITIHASVGAGNADSRAVGDLPAAIPGYTLKCVMQLFADDGVAVGPRTVTDISTGTADFVLQASALDGGATRAAFWAEYIPDDELNAATPKVYDSSDLSAIKYAITDFDATDEAVMAAADAFTGCLTDLRGGQTVTLRRPMIRLNFIPKNPEAADGAKAIKVSYTSPSGYNVLDGTCTATAAQDVCCTNNTFSPTAGNWFSVLILAPTNMATLDSRIDMDISGRVDQRMTIPAGKIPLDANYIFTATAEITRAQTQDLTVEVQIDNNFTNDPDANVEISLGCYINSKGRATLDPYSAVGVVFYMGAISGDNIGLYPEQYAGKTIKAYAVAIENVAATRQQFNATTITAGFTPADKIVNGTQNSATILAGLGESAFTTAWQAWTKEHALTSAGSTTTDWYLPSRNQLEEWFCLILPTYNLKSELIAGTPSGSTALRSLFPLTTIYDRHSEGAWSGCMYASCSVNTGGNIQGGSLSINADGSNGSVKFSQIDVKTKTQSVLGRPMITIFE